MSNGTTQNGWPVDPPLRSFAVSGSDVTLTLIADTNAGGILAWAAAAFHRTVAALDGSQCGGYDTRPIGGLGGSTSNHRSGTAIDLNYTAFPQGARNMTDEQVKACRAIVGAAGGALRWGGDYTGDSLVDQQHIELNTQDGGLLTTIYNKISTGVMPVIGSTPTGPEAATQKPLLQIGPAAQHALIALTRDVYVDPLTNRLAQVRVNGGGMTAELSNAVTGMQMSYSSTQVGQFSMTLADTPEGAIIRSGIFLKGTTIDFNDQHLEVRGLAINPSPSGPQLTVRARSRAVSVLRGPEHTSLEGSTWGEQLVAQWVFDRCNEAGAEVVLQHDLGSLTFTRAAGETTWDTMQTAARQTGCWCYEFEQIITFMRPSGLADRRRARWWDLEWNSNTDYTNGLTEMPAFSWSDDGARQEQMTFRMISADAELARPGDGATLVGNLGEGVGEWVVTGVEVPSRITEPVAVTCGRVVDPAPEAKAATT